MNRPSSIDTPTPGPSNVDDFGDTLLYACLWFELSEAELLLRLMNSSNPEHEVANLKELVLALRSINPSGDNARIEEWCRTPNKHLYGLTPLCAIKSGYNAEVLHLIKETGSL